MNQEELEKKVRHIQLHSRKPVVELLAGEYRSKFKGMGVEFEDVREYQFGDDIRTIDWKVTAKTGKPHVKLFMEERELSLFFLLDVSASGHFGSSEKAKVEVIAHIFALLAFSAVANNDKVGLILFSDQIELFIRPGKGKKHIMNMIHQVLGFKPQSTGTDLNTALDFFQKVQKNSAVAFLVSDFLTEDNFSNNLKFTAYKHDLVCIHLTDAREKFIPKSGILKLIDAEKNQNRFLDTNENAVRQELESLANDREKALKKLCREAGADFLSLCCSEDYLHAIIAFFRQRKEKSLDAL